MSYGDVIAAQLPAVQDPDLSPGPAFATQYNVVIAAVMSVVEAKVNTIHTSIGADVDMNDSVLADVTEARFVSQAALLPRSRWQRALYVFDDDFYINDGRGRTIRLTKDGTLDASATGGISGAGYGVSGVELAWDAAGVYRFKDNAPAADYAAVRTSGLRLYDGSGNYFALVPPVPEVDPGSYSFRFMTALPSAGIPAMLFAGATASFVSLLSHARLPSSRQVKQMVLARQGIGETTAPGPEWFSLSGNGRWFIPIFVHVGERIVSVVLKANLTAGAVVDLVELNYTDTTNPRYTVVASGTVGSSGEQEVPMTPTAPGYVALDARFYGVRIDATSGNTLGWIRSTLEWP